MQIRIMIVDDHAIIRDGLRMVLDNEPDLCVVGEATNGREAVARATELAPDVILMDIAMPVMNGIEATLAINGQLPQTRVIILSMFSTDEYIFRALRANAAGYILKESAGTEVIKAVHAVMKGQRYLGGGVELPGAALANSPPGSGKSPMESLSRREREVLQHVVEGRTSAEIAAMLDLSPKSVETYRSRLMVKLGVANVPALVKFAVLHGITPAGTI